MTLNYKQMVKDISDLVENDFCFDMEARLLPKAPEITQEEAKRMADILSKIYGIAHCIHCSPCQGKYKIK